VDPLLGEQGVVGWWNGATSLYATGPPAAAAVSAASVHVTHCLARSAAFAPLPGEHSQGSLRVRLHACMLWVSARGVVVLPTASIAFAAIPCPAPAAVSLLQAGMAGTQVATCYVVSPRMCRVIATLRLQ
jgi:hypothetical protein